jgi:hypothetical protein
VVLSDHASPPISPPEATAEPAPLNATRHLSAGAYIDDGFCLAALREVYYRPRRIVAPSYGFDAITVLGHCLRSRRSLLLRDAVLVGIVVYATWLSALTVLIVLAALLLFHVALTAVLVSHESIAYLRRSSQFVAEPDQRRWRAAAQTPADRFRRTSLASRGFRRLWLENVVAVLIARVLAMVVTYVIIAAVALTMSIWLWPGSLTVDAPSWTQVTVLIGLAFLVPIATRVWSRLQVHALVPGRTVDRPLMTRRLNDVETQMEGNTVVYSGYRPFVGSGEVLRRWDFAQRLVKPDPRPMGVRRVATSTDPAASREGEREFPTPPFQAQDISDCVRAHMKGIANDTVPERRLPNLTVADRIFVAGTEINDLRPNTPLDRVADIIRNPTAPQRHYLACQVVSWRGELVTTVYVHFAVQGKALYVELYVTGLLPCDERFRVVDEVDGTGVKAVLGDAIRAIGAAPVLVASAPANLFRAGIDQLSVVRTRNLRTLRKGFDYGATIGLREIGASDDTRDPMQTQDIIKYGRVIERRVLAAILDFLEEKGVDIAEYRQRSLTILNAGAVVMGDGTVNVQGDAMGTQQNIQEGGES